MTNETRGKEAGRQYSAAYAAHYTTRDLREALGLYKGLMAAHPRSVEAGYCRAQIQNIVASVVPGQELLDAQMALALSHLGLHGDRAVQLESTSLRRRRDEADSAWEEEQRQRRDAETERRAEARRKSARR